VRVSSDLIRALRWVVPAIAVASLMFWTLATAEPIESPATDPATVEVTRADPERTLPALARADSAEPSERRPRPPRHRRPNAAAR
jgi:hypothetical protein